MKDNNTQIYELEFTLPITVEAENLNQAKEHARTTFYDHLRQVRIMESDFQELEP
jgi:hypothetical protein